MSEETRADLITERNILARELKDLQTELHTSIDSERLALHNNEKLREDNERLKQNIQTLTDQLEDMNVAPWGLES